MQPGSRSQVATRPGEYGAAGIIHVSLDDAVRTIRATGADLKDKYKETFRGGLALNIVEC
jgi:hypothetical protein